MLLNLLQCSGQPPTTKKDLAQTVNSVEVEKFCPRQKEQYLPLADCRRWSSDSWFDQSKVTHTARNGRAQDCPTPLAMLSLQGGWVRFREEDTKWDESLGPHQQQLLCPFIPEWWGGHVLRTGEGGAGTFRWVWVPCHHGTTSALFLWTTQASL